MVLLSPGTGITLFVSISCDIAACLSFFFFFSLYEKLCSNIDYIVNQVLVARSAGEGGVFFLNVFARLNEVGKVGR